ncbi:MAG TPA: MFS transporter [Steroidobacteraceae bacterium]|nr:MFS transporter [Steroidobacteraceae bacterium]
MSEALRLSTPRLIAYALPSVALQSMLVPLYITLPAFYYSPEVGLAPALVGLMFMLARAWEAITDPLIGALSDRTRSRFGPRKPWMAVGAPIAIVSAWYLVHPPAGAHWSYLLALLMVFYAGWTMVFIPYQAWGTELSSDYQERTRIAGFREAGSFTGYLLATVIPLAVLVWIAGIEAPEFGAQVQVIAWFFMAALAIGLLVCFVAVPAAPVLEDQSLKLRDLYGILGRNKPFVRLIVAFFLDRLAMGTYFALQPLLVAGALGLMSSFLIIGVVISLTSIVAVPMWVALARRIGKHRAYVLANAITAACYVAFFFVPVGDAAVLIAVNALLGVGNGGTMVTPPAMTADTVDYDELQSGKQQTGAHIAFLTFVFKLGMAVGAFVGLSFVALFGFESAVGPLTEQSTLGVRIGVALLPAAILLPAMILMWRFPIDRAEHDRIRGELERRRSAPRPANAGAAAGALGVAQA